MHTKLIAAASLICLAYTATSQSRFGVKAGINLANQTKTMAIPGLATPSMETRTAVGYQLGFFYQKNLSNLFRLAAETNFSVIGSRRTIVMSDFNSYNSNEKLGYVDVPVTIQFVMQKLNFGFGPSVGFLLFSKLTNVEDRSFAISGYRTMDAAVNLSTGYQLAEKTAINLRYSHGLFNLYQDPGYASVKNRFFNLSLFYSFKQRRAPLGFSKPY